MRRDAGPPPAFEPTRPLPVRDGRGPGRLRDPRRSGARRPDRARPLPVLRRRRDRSCASRPGCGSSTAASRSSSKAAPADGGSRSPNGSAATPPSATRWPTASRSRTPLGIDRARRRHSGCARCCSSSNGSTTTPPTSARWPTTSASRWPTRTRCGSANSCCASTHAVTGHRLLRGAIRPGGVDVQTLPDPRRLRAIAADLAEVAELTLAQHRGPRPVHRHARPRPTTPATWAASATSPAPAACAPTPAATTRRTDLPVAEAGSHTPATCWPAITVRRDEFAALGRAGLRIWSTSHSRHRPTATARHRPVARCPQRRRHRRGLARHHRAPRRARRRRHAHPVKSSTRPSSTGPRCPSRWPTRSSRTSRWPTRASTSPTPATTCRRSCRAVGRDHRIRQSRRLARRHLSIAKSRSTTRRPA